MVPASPFSKPTTYDARGNLTSAGTTTYAYTSENMLASASGGSSATLAYDPAMRLYQVAGATTTRFAYDGLNLINEYDGANLLLRRYVFGPGIDEPLVQYEGSGTATRRFLHADERGSVVAVSNATGAVFARNSYDEYGIPGSTNYGRFQYTGQVWLPELGLYHYKARTYSPTLGRFLQTDPIGYGDGPNWYNYVGGDPVNFTDPSGMEEHEGTVQYVCPDGNYWTGGECVSDNKDLLPGTFDFGFLDSGLTGLENGSGGGEEVECAYRDRSGQCIYTRDENGDLQFTPEKQKQICENYKAMMRSNTQVSDAASAPGYATVGVVALGGLSGFGQKVLNWVGLPGVAYILGITSGVTRLLSEAPPPPGCE